MGELSWNTLKQLVYERASGCCEYYQTCEANSGQTMQVDHIDPQGDDVLENLCPSCWNCNSSKHKAALVTDPETAARVPLFNPRTQVWSEHFAWIDGGTRVRGLSPIGRATVTRLRWIRGYPAQARAQNDMALGLAQQLTHPYMLARTLYYDTVLCQLRRDIQAVRDQAEAAITVATAQGFALVQALGPIMRGWAVAVQEHSTEGLVQIQQGLDTYRSTGAEFQRPHFLTLLAEASGLLGQPEGGLAALEEALTLVQQTGEGYYEAELHRQRGELLLHAAGRVRKVAKPFSATVWAERVFELPTADAVAESAALTAEECFQHALDVARQQQVKSFELRAAMSLSRLWQHQGKRQEAYDLLAPIYGWFTEGFDTADLQEAWALLDELA